MLSENGMISARQLKLLLILNVFGGGMLIMPRKAAEHAGNGGWLVILFAFVFIAAYTFLMSSLAGMFPNDCYMSYMSKIISRPLAVLFASVLLIKIILSTAVELRIFCDVVKQTILPETPVFAVAACILLVSAYAAYKGYETRARLSEPLFLIIFALLTVTLAVAVSQTDLTNILPQRGVPIGVIVKDSAHMSMSMSGFEYILLSYPFLTSTSKEKGRGQVFRAVLFAGIYSIALFFIIIAKFGVNDIKRLAWPVLELLNMLSLPGFFIERQEALMMSFWIVTIFFIVSAGLFFASFLITDICSAGKKKALEINGKKSYWFIPVVLVIALTIINAERIEAYIDSIYFYFGLTYFIVLPIILIIVAKIRKPEGLHE